MNIVSQSLRLPDEQNKYTSRAEGAWVWNGDATFVDNQWQLDPNSGSRRTAQLDVKTDRQWLDWYGYAVAGPDQQTGQYFNTLLLGTPWDRLLP